ncbi:hypothetical protein EDB89DRAFT_1902592 [Lactarius sanguifluus]|nr:hypothetical protein EDB89DRAFT_1902592 [Lactarius sanguifluus]
MSATRQRVLALYKELHRLGRDYPDANYDFNGRMRRMFEKNRDLKDPAEIEQALRFGEYIKNGTHVRTADPTTGPSFTSPFYGNHIETLALYSLRKYRHLRQRYYHP